MNKYTIEEICKHRDKNDAWIIINNDTDIVIYRYDWCSIYNAFYSSFNKS